MNVGDYTPPPDGPPAPVANDPSDKLSVSSVPATVAHRGGYTVNPLDRALHYARKSFDLRGGEAKLLADEIDALRFRLAGLEK